MRLPRAAAGETAGAGGAGGAEAMVAAGIAIAPSSQGLRRDLAVEVAKHRGQ